MKKPFDVLAEGLDSKNSRSDWIWTASARVGCHRNPPTGQATLRESWRA